MMRAWIGVGLLAVSWLLGLSYYYPANDLAWVILVALGAALLSGSIRRLPGRREIGIALVLLIPMVLFAPWPLRAAPLLIVAGVAVELLPIPRRWPKSLGRGAVAAGVVMLVQALCMAIYAGHTARSHELPWPLPMTLTGIARMLGIDATTDGSAVVMHSMRQVHRLGATWELLVDPATVCFFVGGLVMFGLVVRSRVPGGRRWRAWIGALRTLTLVVVAWLPIRAGLLMALYLHRVVRSDPAWPLHVMDLFLSPWVHLLLLIPPVLLAWRFVRVPAGDQLKSDGQRTELPAGRPKPWRYPAAAGLVLLAVGVFTAAVEWDPVGARKKGRVMVVERHSEWEPTTKPYDTKWFGHDSGYNYRAVYDYCRQYFEMSQLVDPEDSEKLGVEFNKIDDATLENCDVLVIKTPTERYSEEEVKAVVRFVEQGGGLLLVGDHTNYEKSSTYMNDITRQMGFTFRNDLLFGSGDSPYDQLYRPPKTPHPIVQHLPPTEFAVSCSIDPGRSRGRAVIRSTGLWSLPPDYHIPNYHTRPQHRPDMRYGAFIQLWSTRFGKGRVLAFTDSTIFSNFCTFQPGKAELFLGMIEWLNHRNLLGDPRPWLLLVGLLPLGAGLWLARTRREAWLVLLAAGTCGCVLGCVAVAAVGRRTMPLPKPLPGDDRRMVRVVIDRTTSEVPLSKGAYIQGKGKGDQEKETRGTGYGLFEQWISRLDTPRGKLYTTRRSGMDAFSGEVLVVICPSRSVSWEFRQRLIQYVAEGKKLLVIDSPENTASTANSLLWPFGLSVQHDRIVPAGPDEPDRLILADDWPDIRIRQACEITGGRPIAYLGTTPVAAVTTYKQGTVMALGFGSFFNDANLGGSWTAQPGANVLYTSKTYVRYNVQFALLRGLATGQPVDKFFTGHVVLDRTVSEVPLAQEDPTTSEQNGFKGFEDWISYFGYSVARGRDLEALSGDLLVILHPSRNASDEFRENLAQYVSHGGKLLVVDSSDNENSTADGLLEPFGLSFDRSGPVRGELVVTDEDRERWVEVTVEAAWKVNGGEPFAALDEQTPIGSTVSYGKGSVTAVGFGSVFNNANMRASWEAQPAERLLAPANLESTILRALMTQQSVESCVPSVGAQD